MSTGIYGTAAVGLGAGANYVASEAARTAGARGERATAAVLNTFATRAAVLHDLKVPGQKRVNIDHAIVTGCTVIFIDSKNWKPGFYWSAGSTSFRGFFGRTHTSQGVAIAHDRWAKHLSPYKAKVPTPLVAVWSDDQAKTAARALARSSTPGRIAGASPTVWALSYPGAKAVPATALAGRIEKLLVNDTPDPLIVAELCRYLTRQPAPTGF
ncbi:hypothetical protein GCM10011374_35480 [Kocuria dechangensis]|uniref:NERD domain-containing protein n=1 Tax=Kocuria dechangensis TaxID=1176249 RepID=A0A917H5H2_9MICC|nr:nuclease-related domain-containing protein [Kocuria dechangensis]GGG68082.1 hypothetical protein GCM10011374_35480 [Kocuria dechangensis]